MGKASKWFRAILGLRKSNSTHSSKDKRLWGFGKSYREKDCNSNTTSAKHNSFYAHELPVTVSDATLSAESHDADKHAIAVAAATAAVAEAAVAAAQAAAAVVKLTSNSGRCANLSSAYVGSCGGVRDEVAAIKIQSAFRGYLVGSPSFLFMDFHSRFFVCLCIEVNIKMLCLLIFLLNFL